MPVLHHRSPGITAIFNAVKGSNKNGVLDLGAALGTNLSFYSQLGCHFQFENYAQIVNEYVQSDLSESQAIDQFLGDLNTSKKYDVVLFWDLLNFLPKHFIEELVDRLVPVLAPNALIHMINFVGSKVPAHPASYTVNDQYQLQITCSEERAAPVQRSTTMQLLKMFPNFLMVQSYLNGDGMAPGFSEQILRFGAKSQEKGTVFSSAETSNSGLEIESRIYSPTLERFISRVEKNKTLLDLGPKRTFNHDFWKKDYQTVAASDLISILSRYLCAPKEEKQLYLESGRFLDFNSDRKFDVIVTWDLFNYCPNELLEEFGRRLAKHCRDGTYLVVMAYAGNSMPAIPQPFLLDKKGVGLAKLKRDRKLVENKRRLTSSQIVKAFPGFYVEQTFAFRPGMQQGLNEYLFVFKGAERLAIEKEIRMNEVMARRKAREKAESDGSQS